MRQACATERIRALYSDIFEQLRPDEFRKSADLFTFRLQENRFDLTRFRGARCLDAGCGSGRCLLTLADADARSIVGLDFSDRTIRVAGWYLEHFGFGNRIRLVQGDLTCLPFPDESFDVVVCNGVLQAVEEHNRAIFETARVLRRGGTYFVFVHGAYGVHWIIFEYCQRQMQQHVPYETAYRYLKFLGLDDGKVWHYFETWYAAIQKKFTRQELERTFCDLGFKLDMRLTRGIARDTNVLAERYPGMFGEGDLRYFFVKEDPTVVLPNLPSHHREQRSSAGLYGRLGDMLSRLDDLLDTARSPQRTFLVCFILSRLMTDMMERDAFDPVALVNGIQFVSDSLVA